MKKAKRIITFILLAYPYFTNAQQIAIHSPTAANLGLYNEIPVSYYTGIPNISVPLYEIKGKQVNVPISLSYHSAGIRPEIHPGPVGLGWSLQAGGVITRTVRGNAPDESNKDNRSGLVEGYLSCASPSGGIAQNNWKDNAKNKLSNDCLACRNAVWNMAPYSDSEPDEFNFSVLNISGKFYFDHKGKIQIQCDKPIKVIFNNEFIHPYDEGINLNYSDAERHIRAFKSFIIIDEHGTQYYFGGATAIEFSDPISYGRNNNKFGMSGTGELLQANSWFLTQIKSANGADIINFEYERGPFISQLYRSFDYYYYSGAGMSGYRYKNINLDGTLISPVYLKRISVVGGEEINLTYTQSNEVKYSENDYTSIFYPSSANDYKLLDMTSAIPRFQPIAPSNRFDRIQWLKLDNISINNISSTLSQIKFVYNNDATQRLFLNSIKMYGDNIEIEPMNYTFKYKNKSRLPAKYLTCITDHWGFNNGKNYSTSSFNLSSKTPNIYYTDSGILSEIIYPTGGSAKFEYELHDYSKVVNTKNRSLVTNQSGTASGLRIRKIILDNTIREFFYKKTPNSTSSSGVLNMLPQYLYSINGNDCDEKAFSINATRSLPVIPLTKENEGLYITYTYVVEKVSGNNGGYVQYYFTNHDNGHADVLLDGGRWNRDIFPSDPHCSRYFERGRLQKKTFFNNAEKPIGINKTVWDRYGSQGEDNPRAFHFKGIEVGYDYCSSAAYLHYCYKFLPSQRTDTIYDIKGQNPVVKQINYDYNSNYLISQITNISSDGSIRKQRLKYPQDFQFAPYVGMVSKNILSPIIEMSDYKNNLIIDKNISDYALHNNTFYAPINKKYQKGSGNMQIRETYKYNKNNDIKEIIKNDAENIVYLYSYSAKYPIAKIVNANYNVVETALGGKQKIIEFANRINPDKNDIKIFLSSLATSSNTKDAQVTTYTYKPLVGMTSETGPDGRTTFYEYDSFNRLKLVRNHKGNIVKKYDYHYKSN